MTEAAGETILAMTKRAWEERRRVLDSDKHPVVAVLIDAYIARLTPVSDVVELRELGKWLEAVYRPTDKEAGADALSNMMTRDHHFDWTEVRDIRKDATKGTVNDGRPPRMANRRSTRNEVTRSEVARDRG